MRFELAIEQVYDQIMLTTHDIEGLRRSAAMAPLSKNEALRVLDETDRLVRERAEIARLLADLPASFGAVRSTLNELQKLVAD
jgi:hypothetical protein